MLVLSLCENKFINCLMGAFNAIKGYGNKNNADAVKLWSLTTPSHTTSTQSKHIGWDLCMWVPFNVSRNCVKIVRESLFSEKIFHGEMLFYF
jgi:hypothetical protein